jgi:predicted glycosyltransferase
VKILFVIKTLSLSGGGAERVLSAVTAELARRGHDITVATFDRAGAQTFYEFSNRIRLVHLAVGDVTKKTSVAVFVRRVRNLRALARQVRPDVAVGFMHSAYVPLALSLVGT